MCPTLNYKRNPFLYMQQGLNKVVNNFYNLFANSEHLKEINNIVIKPYSDIIEDDEKFKVEVEMPGLDEDNITVFISDGQLIIKGKKEVSHKDEGKNYSMREISYGYYERSFSLPKNIDIDAAKASFKKGMLWVTIPKRPGTEISIKTLEIEKAEQADPG